MDVTNNLANNVRGIRERKKLTLDSASELTGVSRSMLAQIEKGDVNPTISVLWKIANGYKVSFTSLVENPTDEIAVLTQEEVTPLIESDGNYINYPVFMFDAQKLFETYRIVIKPDGYLAAQPHLIGTEEYITVFSGSVEIGVEEKRYQLKRGDSIRFKADVPHSYKNTSDSDAELSMLIYYKD